MNDTPASLDRRGLLAGGLAMAMATAVAQADGPEAFALDDQQPFRGQTRRLRMTRNGRPVASLVFPTDYPTHFRLKPELHHVCTPSGVPVTGSHEFSFIHHQSIMCGHGRVQVDGDDRVVDFYRQLPFPDEQRVDPWHRASRNLFQLGPSGLQHVNEARWRVADQVVVQLELNWQTRERGRDQGDTLAVEQRLYRLARQGQATIVDVFSKLMPAGSAVTLHPENDHGYLGVRLHDFISAENGAMLSDSEGRIGATEHFREPTGDRRVPRWVDCTGNIGAARVGMTLMSHPSNPCNEWYVREFGLMIVSAAQTAAVRITADQPFEFGARFVAHDGNLSPQAADRLRADFAATSGDEIRQWLAG